MVFRFDFALSFAGLDRKKAQEIRDSLRSEGFSVFIDEDFEHELIGQDGREYLHNVYTRQSRYCIVLISHQYDQQNWTQLERESIQSRELTGERDFLIPVKLEDYVPQWLPATRIYFDLTKRPIKELISLLKKKAHPETHAEDYTSHLIEPDNKEHIIHSLRKKLKNDFFTSGPRIGQFGNNAQSIAEGLYYQDRISEIYKLKPAYYLTYWGWRVVSKLLPHLINDWKPLTIKAIKERFAGKRWIDVHLEGYDSGPAAPVRKAETVRHTAKAAEILLLLNDLSIPSQVAWDLINEAPNLTNFGAWKEFRTDESNTSNYLKNAWQENKWRFNTLPSEINAPLALIEYIPFTHNESLVNEVYETLRNLITPGGRLIDPNLGNPYGITEYIVSIRLAYALKLTDSIKHRSDIRVEKLINWVLENYSNENPLNTHDIAFLDELIYLSADT